MKDTIRNADDFANRFKQVRPDNFSRSALEALFEFYEDIEDGSGEEMEFDPVAICCDWSELDEDELRREYDHVDGVKEAEDIDEIAELLNEETSVLDTRNGTLVVAAF